jgi:hypothetical protein
MFRTSDIILVTIMVSAAAFTYKIKHDTDKLRAEIAQIERKISVEKDSMNLLKADWSLLTQPSRLQHLVDAYGAELDLQPVTAEQVAEFADLPGRRVNIDATTGKQLGTMVDNGVDRKSITGGIKE